MKSQEEIQQISNLMIQDNTPYGGCGTCGDARTRTSPPSIMIGIRKGQTASEIIKEAVEVLNNA